MTANSAHASVVLPISSAGKIQQPSGFRTFISGISETVRFNLSNCRPWPELLDRTTFSKPESISEAALRFQKNYIYFRINYLAVISAMIAVSLLTNPFSLFLLAGLLAAWMFLYHLRQPSDPRITLLEHRFSDREMLAILIVCSIVVIFLTSVGTVLLSAVMAGVMIVCAHGAFRVPDYNFLDHPELQGGVPDMLSVLIGVGPSPTVSEPAMGRDGSVTCHGNEEP